MIRSRGQNPHKRGARELPCPLLPCEDTARSLQPSPDHAGALTSVCRPPETVSNTFLLFVSHPVCCVLFLQPEWTETPRVSGAVTLGLLTSHPLPATLCKLLLLRLPVHPFPLTPQMPQVTTKLSRLLCHLVDGPGTSPVVSLPHHHLFLLRTHDLCNSWCASPRRWFREFH